MFRVLLIEFIHFSLFLELQLPSVAATFTDKKRRVSFLFDPSEAGNLDKEAVLGLGEFPFFKILINQLDILLIIFLSALNGLDVLTNLSKVFESFRETLFNAKTLDFTRNITDSKISSFYDAEISKFLLAVSPFIQMKCSWKCLEWLVYKFDCCHFNQLSLLLCFLPYHDTNLFVRVVQILYYDDKSENAGEFLWLEPISKCGKPLPRPNSSKDSLKITIYVLLSVILC